MGKTLGYLYNFRACVFITFHFERNLGISTDTLVWWCVIIEHANRVHILDFALQNTLSVFSIVFENRVLRCIEQ